MGGKCALEVVVSQLSVIGEVLSEKNIGAAGMVEFDIGNIVNLK